jgi:hypothetical protein
VLTSTIQLVEITSIDMTVSQSRDHSMNLATAVQFLAQTGMFFQKPYPKWFEGPAVPIQWVQMGMKQLGCEADHILPSNILVNKLMPGTIIL